MKHSLHKTMLGSLLTAAVTVGATSTAFADERLDKLYLNAHAGFANSNVNVEDVQSAFDRQGLNATVLSVDDTRHGFGIGVGYEISPAWSAELNYLDLGQVDVKFSSTQAINTLEKVHPESGDGFTLSGLYRHALDDKAQVRIRAGLFNWQADYKTTNGAGNPNGSDSDSGTDFYWGVGFAYQLTKYLSITTEMQSIEFDRDKTDYLRTGIEWRFME